MNQKKANSWQKEMYGPFSIALHLDSLKSHQKARQEIKFLIKALNLGTNQSILDVPCGTGRHTLALAQKGYSVVGLDINDFCLKQARKHCKNRKNVQIKKGNMLHLAWAKGKFDVLFNLFSSFGFFKEEQENKQVLKSFVQAVKPGGKIVIQTINREYVLKRFIPFQWKEDSAFHVITKREWDLKTKCVETQEAFLCKKSKTFEKYFYRVRLYSISEMKTLLKKSGLKNIRVFGNSSGASVQRFHSSHPIYIAERPS